MLPVTQTIQSLRQHLDLHVQHSRILIVGIGVTGMSAAHFLHEKGFNFAIVDSRERPDLMAQLKHDFPDISLSTGKFKAEDFAAATHLLVSPGVSLKLQIIADTLAKGVRLISDIDLFVCCITQPVVAITGSNGKSTVTTMLGDMIAEADKKVAIGGNLGEAALDLIDEQVQVYVLELSSFQLERSTLLQAAAATVLNITPDHMDRYQDIGEYALIKRRVFQGNGKMIINLDDPLVADMREANRQMLTFSLHQPADFKLDSDDQAYLTFRGQNLLTVAELPLSGQHNVANALAALALGYAIGLELEIMCTALRQFKGLQHRMQQVAEINGVAWVNDSKATNVGACIAALQGYQNKVILIAGGDAKGADMSALAPVIKAKAKAVVLMGKDAALIAQVLNSSVAVYAVENLLQAVNVAAGLAQAGDHVLLSPACASLDQFKNYQQRGEQFSQAVMGLAA